MRMAYKYYFGCKLGDQDKICAPHICCKTSNVELTQWLNGKRKGMPFAVPMIWREKTNHSTDCYFCLTKVWRHSKRTKSGIVYPDCPSALPPVTHTSENIPIPTPPPVSERENESSSAASLASQSSASFSTETDEEPHSSRVSDVPQLLNQKGLNDLVRDLALTKKNQSILLD